MQTPLRLLLVAACAAILIWVYTKARPAPVASIPYVAAKAVSSTTSTVSIAPSDQSPALQRTPPSSQPAHSGALSATATNLPPAPKNNKELNELADGPLPLSTKMAVLGDLMRKAPPEQAKAAAVRSVFIVRNADYVTQLQPLLVSGEIKREALEVLSLNLYDRPLEIQLPALAAMRNRVGHPLEQVVADALVFHLKDKGTATGDSLAQNIKDYLTPPSP